MQHAPLIFGPHACICVTHEIKTSQHSANCDEVVGNALFIVCDFYHKYNSARCHTKIVMKITNKVPNCLDNQLV